MNKGILLPKEEYVIEYPQAIEFSKRQASIFWHPDEIDVGKDLHDLKTNFTPSELHGIIYVLKLFTLYERRVGNDYWRDYISSIFKRPEIENMSSLFSAIENSVHAPFYNKINEVLGLDTEEFYNSYKEDSVLLNRMIWLGKRVEKKTTLYDILKSIGTFSVIEGGILFSNFAFIKHFNSLGKNKLVNINAGINFSANDEVIHSEAGAWLFNTLLQENIEDIEREDLVNDILESVEKVREHEFYIIDNTFSQGEMEGISPYQLKVFVESRLDTCMGNLGIKKIYKPKDNPIAEWFYSDLNSSVQHDFFVASGNSYNRKWDQRRFVW